MIYGGVEMKMVTLNDVDCEQTSDRRSREEDERRSGVDWRNRCRRWQEGGSTAFGSKTVKDKSMVG